jgi:NCS1 family nucleobase:cation symporter-1
MYSREPTGRYWFWHGFNPNAILATVISGFPAIGSVLAPKLGELFGANAAQLHGFSDYSWFVYF